MSAAPPFAPRCLSIDLEVGKEDGHIHQFAGVRGDSGEVVTYARGDLNPALARLDALAEGAAFVLGHNLISFDLPHLQAASPGLRLLELPAVDTLRLNPLAFPRHPYHHLVKHYLDGQLQRERRNDPELDARLTLEVFRNQRTAFLALRETNPDLLTAWHWLATVEEGRSGLNAFFTAVRGQPRPGEVVALAAISRLLDGVACRTHARWVLLEAESNAWPLAYALAWLSVAGGNSVMPPWVRHQFPEAGRLVRRLRDTPCGDPACPWCSERHDAVKELQRWFRFPGFRPSPDGRPLQQQIVAAAMAGEHVLGILPTGMGKSLCYQVPALSRYDKTGALCVVISPLVALMADQVKGLEARGITCAVAVNGLLSMPERGDALDRVRLGEVGILIISPEQLRSVSVRRALAQREIGAWVLDEAHCLSKWGHDFRPDYRYVGRFIREGAGTGDIPPILCLTATAKPEVVADIQAYFRDQEGVALKLFDGGSERDNLSFDVIPTTQGEKPAHLHQVLLDALPPGEPGGAIIYASTRKHAEDYAKFLGQMGIAAEYFHAGLSPEKKKDVQRRFVEGELRVITATNAFGMGIDKPDVRLVIHADIPGSLENYLQEAGRAGRDRALARCVLLYTPEDVERQFGLSARSRLTRREIQAVLKSVRRLDRKKHLNGEVIATAGEILAEEMDGEFERDSTSDDTRVRTALSWLEESHLLTREENRVSVFPSSLRVASLEEAKKRLLMRPLPQDYRRQLLKIVEALMAADADEGLSTDELMAVAGLSPEQTRHALYDLEHLGIASNDTALTAFVHRGVERSSEKRLAAATALEQDLIALLREAAPDLEPGGESMLHLSNTCQRLKDLGHAKATPEQVWRLVRGLAGDGQGDDEGGGGSLAAKKQNRDIAHITLLRPWGALEKTARLRREGAARLLQHLLACLPEGQRGMDLLAETTLGKLLAALNADLALHGAMKDPARLLDRALLWLHEQEILRLNKGLAVFRPAMTLRLDRGTRGFRDDDFERDDFEPLKLHYDEQVFQVHVMAEYAARGLEAVAEAVNLALDYFRQARADFIRRWLPDRAAELARQTTPASWQKIVENLKNPKQQAIVADKREDTNVLVLAGPGSGKTRVLVHRIAYLVRARRENPHGILALTYNRHAAVEIRQRLYDLIGDDAHGVTVLTCHALAMRLGGVSFAERSGRDQPDFQQVLRDAIALLKGDGLPPDEADEQRDRLLAGYRWILVDEYQDIDADQYELISALAGRTRVDADGKLTLFAVGDDDQNVYGFKGASVEFIRRFEQDYQAKPVYLIDNYRSTAHIIAAANAVIAQAVERMKVDHPIRIDRTRRKAPAGDDWDQLDPVARGRVQILPAGADHYSQARAVMAELQRLASLDAAWDWKRVAVIARKWDDLNPIRAYCEAHGIPVESAEETAPPFWRLRETQAFVAWLLAPGQGVLKGETVNAWLATQRPGLWWDVLREAVTEYREETGDADLPPAHLLEWLADWGREVRRRQNGLLLTSAHRAKGLEFDQVVVLDGDWSLRGPGEDAEAARRLYYVAMTRARRGLVLARMQRPHPLLDVLPDLPCLLRRPASNLPEPDPALARQYRRIYQRLTLKEVDIGYTGRQPPRSSIHATIAALQPGDPLTLYLEGRVICNGEGIQVGLLAKGYRSPAGMRCVQAQVSAVVVRERAQSDAEYQHLAKCESWEVVLPELVFAPD